MIIAIQEQLDRIDDPEAKALLLEFQYITLNEHYIADDAENYLEFASYLELFQEIAQLTELDFGAIKGTAGNGLFTFSFSLDQTAYSFSIAAPQGDWIDQRFAAELNAVLQQHGLEYGLYFVFVLGLSNADQCFHLVYIDARTYKELQRHPDRYAWPDDDAD